MTNEPGLYKTLVMGELVQTTAFSIGGNRPHGRVDAPVARDGEGDESGRLTIRGTGLAGALIAVARRLSTDDDLLYRISAGTPTDQSERRQAIAKDKEMERLPESLWRFHNAHPLEDEEPNLEVRSGVGIRHDTGAAAAGIKFETETVSAGTVWRFLMEIDDYREPGTRAGALAMSALREWEAGHCFLGRDVARGLGWMRLRNVQIRVLSPDDAGDWPNAYLKPVQAFNALSAVALLSDADRRTLENSIEVRPRHIVSGRGSIQIGAADHDPWGLDTLSLGGSEALRPIQEKVVTKASLGLERLDMMEPDLVLAWTRPTGADESAAEPFIPGSSLRGPLRHALSWWLRRNGHEIADPNAADGTTDATDEVAALFGNLDRSALLLLSDAMLEDPGETNLMFMEQHAEDEFSAGACGQMKFNRLCLSGGRFCFAFHLEVDQGPDAETQLTRLRSLLGDLAVLGRSQQIPLGGGQWRGHGWVRWDLDFDSAQQPTDEGR